MAARKRSNRNRAAWEPAGGYAHRGEPDPRAKDPQVEGRLREALARAKDAYMSGGDDYAREALYRAMDSGRYALDFGDVWSQQNAIQRIEGTLARNGAGGRRRNRSGMPKRSARSEKIPGTRAVGQRIAHAEDNFIDTLSRMGGIGRADALRVFEHYKRIRAVKRDAVGGVYNVKHGAFLDRDVILRALEADRSRNRSGMPKRSARTGRFLKAR